MRNRYQECEIKVMYEAGFQGFWLHDLLEEDGIDCCVTPANKVTWAKDDRVKTDKRDARRLAQSSEQVRSWLIECSWHAIRKDPALLEKFRVNSEVIQMMWKYGKRYRRFPHSHIIATTIYSNTRLVVLFSS